MQTALGVSKSPDSIFRVASDVATAGVVDRVGSNDLATLDGTPVHAVVAALGGSCLQWTDNGSISVDAASSSVFDRTTASWALLGVRRWDSRGGTRAYCGKKAGAGAANPGYVVLTNTQGRIITQTDDGTTLSQNLGNTNWDDDAVTYWLLRHDQNANVNALYVSRGGTETTHDDTNNPGLTLTNAATFQWGDNYLANDAGEDAYLAVFSGTNAEGWGATELGSFADYVGL
jgi:hypothetical protein